MKNLNDNNKKYLDKQTSNQIYKIPTHCVPNNLIAGIGCMGGIFIHIVIGSLFNWGIISTYITSYFKISDPGLTFQYTAIVFPLMMVCIGFTMRLGQFLSQKLHPVFVLFVSQICSAACIFISAFMTNFWLFTLFYSILFGLFVGVSYLIPIIQFNRYLFHKKSISDSIIGIGTGIGPIVFGMFAFTYLNGNEINSLSGYFVGSLQLEQIGLGIPNMLKWLSLIYLGFGLFGVLFTAPMCILNRKSQIFLKNQYKTQKVQSNENTIKIRSQSQIIKKSLFQQYPKNLKIAMCSSIFWDVGLIFLIGSCGIFLFNGNYRLYVKNQIVDDEFLTIIGVVAAAGHGCSKIIWGFLFQKTGLKTILLSILVTTIVIYATIRTTQSKKQTYLVAIFFLNCCLGGYFVAMIMAVQQIFGYIQAINVYPIYWLFFACSNLVQFALVSRSNQVIGFNNIIYICLAFAVFTIPFVIFITFKGPWSHSTRLLGFCGYLKRKQPLKQQKKQKVQINPQQKSYSLDIKLRLSNSSYFQQQLQSSQKKSDNENVNRYRQNYDIEANQNTRNNKYNRSQEPMVKEQYQTYNNALKQNRDAKDLQKKSNKRNLQRNNSLNSTGVRFNQMPSSSAFFQMFEINEYKSRL